MSLGPNRFLDPAHRIDDECLGWLESPRELASTADCAIVSGWVFSRGASIVRVVARANGRDVELKYGLSRPDVFAVYSADADAQASGFSGFVELDTRPTRFRPLEVWAQLSDERFLRLFTTRPSLRSYGRRLIDRMLLRNPRPTPPAPQRAGDLPVGEPAAAFVQVRRRELQTFLLSGSRLAFPSHAVPVVTVVVVAWNRAELLFGCLRAVRQSSVPLEVVIVDNASTDETAQLLRQIDGVRVLTNPDNRGFTGAANQGAAAATGEFLLLLNSDAELFPDCLDRLVATLHREPSVGAVGAKLIWPDGRLQEAGSVIWSDGSCVGYGRGENPADDLFNFRRDVDFCSAAVLLTRTDLFRELRGLEERYAPGYYEDADYCARIWESGRRVVFEPSALAIHVESASSNMTTAIGQQLERRAIFVQRRAAWLQKQPPPHTDLLKARRHPWNKPSILVIDDSLPDPTRGAGFPRSFALVEALGSLGYAVSVYATSQSSPSAPARQRLHWVETILGRGPNGLEEFLRDRRHAYQAILVSRPHNLRYLKAAVGKDLRSLGVPVVYDAEAVFATRDAGRARIEGHELPAEQAATLVREEARLALGSAAVLTVTEGDRRLFEEAGIRNISVLSHSLKPQDSPGLEPSRDSVLFVGSFGGDGPNDDALKYLVRLVAPAIRAAQCSARIVVAGHGLRRASAEFGECGIRFVSDPESLEELYAQARVFIAPTRYAAGIPLKILEAAAHGVPVIATPVLASQLGWEAGREILVASSPEEFGQSVRRLFDDDKLWLALRDSGHAAVARSCDPDRFLAALSGGLSSAGCPGMESKGQL